MIFKSLFYVLPNRYKIAYNVMSKRMKSRYYVSIYKKEFC